jgi:hypothetical protein
MSRINDTESINWLLGTQGKKETAKNSYFWASTPKMSCMKRFLLRRQKNLVAMEGGTDNDWTND